MITNMSHNEISEEELATITGGNHESMPAINPGNYNGGGNTPTLGLPTGGWFVDWILKNLKP